MDGFCLKITFQEIYFIIWDGSVVCMMVIFFTTTDLSPCLAICLWTRFTLYGVPLSLRGAADLDSAVSLPGIIINLFHLPAEFLIFLLPV